MGGSTALLAAAQSDDVVGVVADSPFSDLEDYLKVNLPVWSHLPDFPFTPLILGIMPIITDLDPKEPSPNSVLDDIAPLKSRSPLSDTSQDRKNTRLNSSNMRNYYADLY